MNLITILSGLKRAKNQRGKAETTPEDVLVIKDAKKVRDYMINYGPKNVEEKTWIPGKAKMKTQMKSDTRIDLENVCLIERKQLALSSSLLSSVTSNIPSTHFSSSDTFLLAIIVNL
uniref:Uncharacterized protein n=1 Tax=Tetranychus urticae TaxID=32264 RepID=T1K3W6_TETUR